MLRLRRRPGAMGRRYRSFGPVPRQPVLCPSGPINAGPNAGSRVVGPRPPPNIRRRPQLAPGPPTDRHGEVRSPAKLANPLVGHPENPGDVGLAVEPWASHPPWSIGQCEGPEVSLIRPVPADSTRPRQPCLTQEKHASVDGRSRQGVGANLTSRLSQKISKSKGGAFMQV
jgi:hypothetical protein